MTNSALGTAWHFLDFVVGCSISVCMRALVRCHSWSFADQDQTLTTWRGAWGADTVQVDPSITQSIRGVSGVTVVIFFSCLARVRYE